MGKRLAAGYFHKPVSNRAYGFEWPEKSVAMIPFTKSDRGLLKIIQSGVIDMNGIDYFFKDFHCNNGGRRIFAHIQNGIGDMFAFSSVAWYLRDYPLQVHVGKKFHPVFDWFRRGGIVLKDYYDPIVKDYTPANRLTKYRYLHRLAIENAAVEYGTGNWFEAHYKRLGLDATPEGYDRPMLKKDRINNSKSLIAKDGIIISHRSSCQMRSSKLEDFYYPVKSITKNKPLYVHETDLTAEDIEFLKKHGVSINVLPKCDITQYLLNIFDAAFVVSTDSSALHFREGIEKPALGVYGAMLAASRVSGYKYVKAFDVKTGCPFQPCVIHERKKGEVCKNANEGDLFARCQSGDMFQDQLHEQLKMML